MKPVQAVKCEMCVFSERDGIISQLCHTQVKKMEAWILSNGLSLNYGSIAVKVSLATLAILLSDRLVLLILCAWYECKVMV